MATHEIYCHECRKTVYDKINEFSANLQANMHIQANGHTVDVTEIP